MTARDLNFAENTEKTAVGSRTRESATKFAEEHGVSHAYGSYEELVQDPDVDAIYVATPHPFHKENVLAVFVLARLSFVRSLLR